MIKLINLLKRNPAMSLQEFIDYYENVHRFIGEKYFKGYADRYLRRYLRPVPASIYPAEMQRKYDVVMEVWFPDQKTWEACFKRMVIPEAQAEIQEDSAKMFDLKNMHFFVAEEYESQMEKSIATDGDAETIKTINLFKRNPSLSLEGFIDHYENVHRFVGEKYLSKFAVKYLRRFLRPVPQSIYPSEMVRNYDVVMEMWFPDQKAFEDCFAVMVTPEAQAEIAADEEDLFDYENMEFFLAEEHASDLKK